MPRRNRNRRKNKGSDSLLRSAHGTVTSSNAVLRIPRYSSAVLAAGLPDRLRIPLIYVEHVTFTSTTGAVSNQLYWGNSAYDPNQTGTGAQPAWFDYFSAMYTNCFVKASRLQLVAKSNTASQIGEIVVSPLSNSGPSSLQDLQTNPFSVNGSISQNQASWNCDLSMSTRDILGLDDKVSEALAYCSSAANPGAPYDWYWRIKYQTADGASTSAAIMEVKLTYDCVFMKRLSSDVDLTEMAYRRKKRVEQAKLNAGKPTPAMTDKQWKAFETSFLASKSEKDWVIPDRGDRKG